MVSVGDSFVNLYRYVSKDGICICKCKSGIWGEILLGLEILKLTIIVGMFVQIDMTMEYGILFYCILLLSSNKL